MNKLGKLMLACLLCLGLVVGLVWLVQSLILGGNDAA